MQRATGDFGRPYAIKGSLGNLKTSKQDAPRVRRATAEIPLGGGRRYPSTSLIESFSTLLTN